VRRADKLTKFMYLEVVASTSLSPKAMPEGVQGYLLKTIFHFPKQLPPKSPHICTQFMPRGSTHPSVKWVTSGKAVGA